MKIKFLNKSIEPQRFRYTPRYYDERKERMEEKKKHYSKIHSESVSDEDRMTYLRDNLRESWSRSEYRHAQRKSSNLRVLLLVGLILALGYFVFNGIDEVDTVVKNLW